MASLDGFTSPSPFTVATASKAPSEPGVHVVVDPHDVPVYVGATRDLRRRLREHLQGDRQASVLHEQVGRELDSDGVTASAADIAAWLGQCTVMWTPSDDPRQIKAQLVAELQPRFNRTVEQPTTGLWWVNQGLSYEQERAAGIVFAGTGGPQVTHHLNVARMQPGDVVLHYRQGLVVALSEAVEAPVQTKRPYGNPAERDDGWLTRVEYFPLDPPIPLADLPERSAQGPFNAVGGVKQGYLFALDREFGDEIKDAFHDRWPAGSPWAAGARRFWLFQANPKQWDLLAHLPEMPPGHLEDWTVTRHRHDMQPGDGVVLWQGGANAAILALGRLHGVPELRDKPEFRPETGKEQEYRVELVIERHVQPAITKQQVQSDPDLAALEVLRRPWGGTNLPVTADQWRAIRRRLPLEVSAITEVPGGQGVDELAELVEQFRTDVGYPAEGRTERDQQREDLAAALAGEGLAEPDVRLLRRLAGPAYGSPGPQPGFNTLLQSEEGVARVADTLRHLLHGPGDVVGRLEECLSGEHKLPKVGEAMMVKALAVVDPERWFPNYVTGGKVGKLAILELLGTERPEAASAAGRAAASNDAVRALLEPHFPSDPWGMQEFTWWLLHREHVPESPLTVLADELYLSEEFLERILRLLHDKGQVVFYGPPGTGKTFAARKLAGHIARGGGTVEKIQFHASYSYEDLIEGYRPRLVNGQVSYEVVDGPLKRLAATAEERPDVTHVLLIDELNRGNVSKILGELLFLLEYRDEEIRLLYSEAPFSLPPNLQIVATMNTADRSIALVDAALRRRFHFVPFFPDTPPISTLLRRWLTDKQPSQLWVADVVDRANELLADRNIAIGPSHFLKADLTDELVNLAWEASVLPFLEEYFFSDPDQLRKFELDRLRAATTPVPTVGEVQSQPDQGSTET